MPLNIKDLSNFMQLWKRIKVYLHPFKIVFTNNVMRIVNSGCTFIQF